MDGIRSTELFNDLELHALEVINSPTAQRKRRGWYGFVERLKPFLAQLEKSLEPQRVNELANLRKSDPFFVYAITARNHISHPEDPARDGMLATSTKSASTSIGGIFNVKEGVDIPFLNVSIIEKDGRKTRADGVVSGGMKPEFADPENAPSVTIDKGSIILNEVVDIGGNVHYPPQDAEGRIVSVETCVRHVMKELHPFLR